jgi:LL-diaminopimelate aminotransferase
MIIPAKRLDSIQEYYFSKKLKEIAAMNSNGHHVLNLGIGSPDLPPSDATIAALSLESQNKNQHAYQSYVGIPALRKAFADWYLQHFKVELNPINEILPLLGSKEGIMHTCMTYLERGDKALIPNPGYPAYRAAVTLAGATCIEYDLEEKKGWMVDIDKLSKRKDLNKVKLMWLNYPNMPTGAKATKEFFEELVAFAKENQILLINDNPYSFVLNTEHLSLLSVEGAREVALELNSLSKSHNMAGWRVGMLAGKSEFLSDILRFKSNMDSGMFLPVQLAAVQALSNDQHWFDELNTIYKVRQEKVFELLHFLACKFDPKQTGMFVWAKIPSNYKSGYELSDKILYDAKVFITPGGIFGSRGDKFIRVSLCSNLEIFEEAIKRCRHTNSDNK